MNLEAGNFTKDSEYSENHFFHTVLQKKKFIFEIKLWKTYLN